MSLDQVQEFDTAQVGAVAADRTPPRETLTFKFGGTSLFGARRMLHAASLVCEAAGEARVVVVVSAMKGVTDRLLDIAHSLCQGDIERARFEAESIIRLHEDALSKLVAGSEEGARGSLHDIRLLGRDLLHAVADSRRVGSEGELCDQLASFGERFSARLLAAALAARGVRAVPVSSSDFVRTCDTFRDAQPDLAETRRRGGEVLGPLLEDGIVPVVTGFIGATHDGRITTLGRNSSDFSGAIIAHVVDADELVIWTDVDGIYTENPQESSEARLLHELSYDEAHALASAGAKVLHAKVLPLAAEAEMVVWVRNTFNPGARGTRIGPAQTSGVA